MMETDHHRVREYYASFDEWARLDTAEGAVEYRRTLPLLRTHLSPGSRVLDIGGGPGRYAADLAASGHRVVLADVAPELLAVARRRLAGLTNIESIDEANALDLGLYAPESFDAVLALGPFYHLVSPDERNRAADEIARVLRPEGVAFVAYIPRVSGLTGLVQRAAAKPEQVPSEVMQFAADTGVFRNPSAKGFQEGYYPWPGELEALFEAKAFRIVDVVSLRSIAHRLGEDLARLDSARRREVDRLMEALSRRPEVVATSGHVMLIGKKARPSESAAGTAEPAAAADWPSAAR